MFGVVSEKTVTPVRTMYLLLVVGLALIFVSSFQSSIAAILADSVAAIAVPRLEATGFGVVQTAADGHRIDAFLEKRAPVWSGT